MRAELDADAAFRKEEHTIFALSFIFLHSEILSLCQATLAISSSFSFTPLTYLAGLL